jgi:hypothetical protein
VGVKPEAAETVVLRQFAVVSLFYFIEKILGCQDF